MVDTIYGKPIDVQKLKKPVLKGLRTHLNQVISTIDYLAKNEKPIPQKTCYICSSSQSTPFALIHGFQYLMCSECRHVYTSYRYDEGAIIRFYQQNKYYSEITYANKETCFYRRENVQRPKIEFTERYTGNEKGIWIDVGSGIGDLVSILLEKGWNAIGLEISETSIKFAKEVFNVTLVPELFQKYCREHPEMHGTAEVVSLMGIIEHTVNPLEFLQLAHQMLKKDGRLMIQVPNALSFAGMVQKVYPENVFRLMNPIDHIMVFTRDSLEKAFELTGFKTEGLWFHGLDIYELLNSLTLANERIQNSDLSSTFYEVMNELQLVIDKKELSNSLLCVAKKTEAPVTEGHK